MQEKKFAIDDIVSIYANPDYFNGINCPPFTFTNPNCDGDSSESSTTIDECEVLYNKDVKVELDCHGRVLTIRIIYPKGNKKNFHMDLLI